MATVDLSKTLWISQTLKIISFRYVAGLRLIRQEFSSREGMLAAALEMASDGYRVM